MSEGDVGVMDWTPDQYREARANNTVWHLFEWIQDLAAHDRLTAALLQQRMWWAIAWGTTWDVTVDDGGNSRTTVGLAKSPHQ